MRLSAFENYNKSDTVVLQEQIGLFCTGLGSLVTNGTLFEARKPCMLGWTMPD